MDSYSISDYFKRGQTVVLTLKQGTDHEVEGVRQWTDKDTFLLIKQMNDFLPEFQNPRKRKKDVWESVAKEQQRHGSPWSAEDCRKKWSNMIRTLKGIEEQRHDPTTKSKRIKWPFFEGMHELLSLEGSDAFPESSNLGQILNANANYDGLSTIGNTRKRPSTPKPALSSSSTFTQQEIANSIPTSSLFLDSHQHNSIQLSHTDVISLGDHDTGTDINTGLEDTDGNLFSEEQLRFFRTGTSTTESQSQQQRQPEPSTSSNYNKNGSSSTLTKKLRKITKKKPPSSNFGSSSLSRFMEDLKKQNDTMIKKLTIFHANALSIMQERNELLKDIRDSLVGPKASPSSSAVIAEEDDNESMEEQDDEDNPDANDDQLTLQIGPVFSTANNNIVMAPTTSHSIMNSTVGPTVVSNMNQTLVIADPTSSTSTLSTFQLVNDPDGSILKNFTTSAGGSNNTVLTTLGPFTTTTDPDLHEVSLLNPSVVSVMSNTEGGNVSTINLVEAAVKNFKKK